MNNRRPNNSYGNYAPQQHHQQQQQQPPRGGGDGPDDGPLSKTNVFIRGLSATTNDQDLYELCSKYGTIVSSKSITNRATNACKGYGFVNFENSEDAAVCISQLKNRGFQAKMSRENMGKGERNSFNGGTTDSRPSPQGFMRRNNNNNSNNFNGNSMGRRFNGNGNGGGPPQYSKTNLYLRGLDAATSDNDLHELCTRYGNILSAKAIVDRATNACKGYGFVNFESPYSAEQAVIDLSSKGYQVQMSREARVPREPILVDAPDWQ